jgi:hypothetical protein
VSAIALLLFLNRGKSIFPLRLYKSANGTFPAHNGGQCGCTGNLEIDHVVPFAAGGNTTAENLRVVCAAHNLFAEITYFGKEFVERKIAAG